MFERLGRKLAAAIAEKLLALLPIIAAAVAKAVMDQLKVVIPNIPDISDVGQLSNEVVDNILDADPDLPFISDLIDVSEVFRRLRNR